MVTGDPKQSDAGGSDQLARTGHNDAAAHSQPDLAAVVHETTNALTVILGWIERAQEVEAEPARQQALARASEHARSARDMMRRAIGADMPVPAPESVAALATRTLDDLAVEARRAAVTTTMSVPEEWGRHSVAHPSTVWQILTNLLLNGIAVTPAGGTVSLEVAGADNAGYLRFSVSDQGPGITTEQQQWLFSSGFTTRSGGAGIGLKHAYTLAQQLGGRLELSPSEQGARFDLHLPISTTPTGRPASLPATKPDKSNVLQGSRVLLLEDDSAVSELLELALQARGAQITAVRTTAGLEQELQQGSFEILLLDLSPLNGGLDDVLRKAQAGNPDALTVVISGSAIGPPRTDVVWVRKPFEPGELVSAILQAQSNGRS